MRLVGTLCLLVIAGAALGGCVGDGYPPASIETAVPASATPAGSVVLRPAGAAQPVVAPVGHASRTLVGRRTQGFELATEGAPTGYDHDYERMRRLRGGALRGR